MLALGALFNAFLMANSGLCGKGQPGPFRHLDQGFPSSDCPKPIFLFSGKQGGSNEQKAAVGR
jgi:hypothetical protein